MIVVYVVIAISALIADAALSAFGNNKVYHTYFNAGSKKQLNPRPQTAAIEALIAITTYTTIINAVINSVIAVVLYAALRPALKRAGFLAAQ